MPKKISKSKSVLFENDSTKKNDNEIKQRIDLLKTFFQIPSYNSRFRLIDRNRGVLAISEFINKNKLFIFKEYFQ